MTGLSRERHVVAGRVQGVGFRPFVYRLALESGVTGFVRNAPEGVVIEVQGPSEALESFARSFRETLPPLALVVEHSRAGVPVVEAEEGFAILKSAAGTGHHVLVSPDIATCPDCLADMADPAGRRRDYPFTNCTNCGPRYTITRSLPYDRSVTSMACFPLCEACRAEYEDPLDRRFHAQPNACPACGPRLWLADRKGRALARNGKAVDKAAKELGRGAILALKGLGGFHLAADAFNHDAVAALRRRKRRPSKPLAVMVADLAALRALAEPSPEEARMLEGRERPIVLVRLRPGTGLSPLVSPDTMELGVMLPYTPLHHVLLARLGELRGAPAALVMTSGNASSEPLCLGNREALARLGGIADRFLLHDRDILVRTDDSVVRFLKPQGGEPRLQFLRRARGWTPSPVFLASKGPSVLGVGPELKNTVCVTKNDQAFLSQHVGDMGNLETARFHREVVEHLCGMLQVRPELAVADKHPDYLSTRWALEESGLPVARLQHHFAHVFAAMASNRLDEPVLGLALDGSGLGDDGTIWGGEFLYVDPRDLTMRRAGHFAPMRLPGGEAAIREPWRMAAACLKAVGRDPLSLGLPWIEGRAQAASLVCSMLEKGINSPVTTSCGRLFDAVSALAGLCDRAEYEGQAAIRLEAAASGLPEGSAEGYDCPLQEGDPVVLDTLALFDQAVRDILAGAAARQVSRRFHHGLCTGLAECAWNLCKKLGTRRIVLSGGVFLNGSLSTLLPKLLDARGAMIDMHWQEPPGDGCISLGQALYGKWVLEGRGEGVSG
ncbi:Carbamoyltransferase HypF [Fundidesulfovibrio magnetotacticus]|uniref:Carbamoyltransferase n=1 Tax=Fundidesulfovibrio magnetotacticus TaxID=2730080 RepID=A0A6V8LVL6_9BACT|nr:carbamoyltransferase HypF [Fundidesulfovibrio magnetotacticus]GFK94980.1 Carbamoyltransferase HypF [Fundidesulfovibrio magnetotacticus]